MMRPVTVRVPDEDYELMKMATESRRESQSQLIRRALRKEFFSLNLIKPTDIEKRTLSLRDNG